MINIGGNIGELYVGSTPIEKAYIGSQLVWEKTPAVLPYDAEVEYIQGNGSAWIDAQYTTTSNSIITIVVQLSSLGTQDRIVGNSTGYFEIYLNGSKRWAYASNGTVVSSGVSANTSKHTLKIDNVAKKGYWDNSSKTIQQNAATYYGSTYLFSRAGSRSCSGNIFSATIYNGSTLVRDYIPVRVGTIGCLYDKVSGTLFYSSGSSDFAAGPDVT